MCVCMEGVYMCDWVVSAPPTGPLSPTADAHLQQALEWLQEFLRPLCAPLVRVSGGQNCVLSV